MDGSSPLTFEQLVAACTQQASAIGAALSQCWESPVEVALAEPGVWDASVERAGWDSPGLIVSLRIEQQAALLIVPSADGDLPAALAHADQKADGRLATLAAALAKLLLPEGLACDEALAAVVSDLAQSVQRGSVAEDAGSLGLTLTSGGRQHAAILLWPVAHSQRVFESGATSLDDKFKTPAASPQPQSSESPFPEPWPASNEDRFAQLPAYSRNLLRIQVPVMVTLASKRQPVSKIVEIVPGSILQFDKSCDELLELEVGTQRVAQGECVKVGDKFGLRIVSLILPSERFASVVAP